MKNLILLSAVLILSGCGENTSTDEKKIRFYQSPMHPWVKAEEPGRCTICGMALVPIYEGEEGFSAEGDTIMLSESSIQVVGVQTALVEEGELSSELRLAGIFENDAGRRSVVSAYFDGRIEKPFIEQVGEEVRKGQALLEIYSPDLLYVVREYQQSVETGNRRVAGVAAQRLVQFGLTPEQVEQMAGAAKDGYGIDILSPITGTVIRRHVESGQYVKTGDPLFELGDFSKMWFQATVYESDISFLRLGQEARITTPAAPGKTYRGIVTLIDPSFDPAMRSTMVRIEVANPMQKTIHGERRELPHLAYGEATIEVELGHGLVVPRSAVLDTGRRAVVFVDKGEGVYKLRHVEVAARGSKAALISSGLAMGERVVVEGNLLLDAESQMKDPGSAQDALVEHDGHPAEKRELPEHPLDSELLRIAALGAALAADDLNGVKTAAGEIAPTLPPLPESSPQDISMAYERLSKVLSIDRNPGALEEARAAYLPLFEAAAELVHALHENRHGAADFVVFACPMTETAFQGAPAKARWIQAGRPLRNPWFGAEMLDCGAEVLP